MRAAGLSALGLWSMAGAYSMRGDVLSDGWVPQHFVDTWPGGKRAASALVKVGLWSPEERDGLPGYRFHDFLDFQRAAQKIQAERRSARDRMAALRAVTKPSTREGRSRNVQPNKPRTHDERSGEVPPKFGDSLSLSPRGTSRGERPVSNRAREQRPPDRCDQHQADEHPPPCGACADARRTAETWDRERRATTRACPFCDADGWRYEFGRRIPITPYVRCDHTPPERP